MKTFSRLLTTLLLTACSACAQNFMERMGASFGPRLSKAQLEQMRQQALRTQSLQQLEARRAGNPALAFSGVEFEPLHRVADGRPVSLKPMLYWRNAGVAFWEAYQPFAYTNPLAGWTVIEGKVAMLRKDVVIVQRESDRIALRNWPGAETALTEQSVRVLARPSGRYQSGVAAVLEFDHGAAPALADAEALVKADTEMDASRAAAQARAKDAAAEAEAKRKADIAARVEKARADRAIKEAKEKLEGK